MRAKSPMPNPWILAMLIVAVVVLSSALVLS